MIIVNDKNGKRIHIQDRVQREEKFYLVSMVPESGKIQIIPEEEGLPIIVPAEEVIVIESFFDLLNTTATAEEIKTIFEKLKTGFVPTPEKKSHKSKIKAEKELPGVEVEI